MASNTGETEPVLQFSCRDATASDLQLAYEITRDAMRQYVAQTWGDWDEEEQFRRHRESFTPSTHRFICVGAREVGLIAAEDSSDFISLVKLYVRAGARGQGIGSAVLSDLIQRADSLGLPVRLRVLRVNERAQALYSRHGFRVVGETAERCYMERASRTG
jgi:ribosomal protein S18 acetylase RimI-like enzyme